MSLNVGLGFNFYVQITLKASESDELCMYESL